MYKRQAVESRSDKRPMLSDLRESGAIEQDADVVCFLYREQYYKPDTIDKKNQAEVIIAKQRNGPLGTVNLAWLGQYTKFENLEINEYDIDVSDLEMCIRDSVSPDDSDTYILGILIDGYNCKEASTTRDRFVLQPSVLKGLGWSVIRLWTLDWLDNPEKVKNKIKEAIEAAPKTPKIKKTVSPETFAKLQFEKETVISNTSYKKDYISTKISNMGTADELSLIHI